MSASLTHSQGPYKFLLLFSLVVDFLDRFELIVQTIQASVHNTFVNIVNFNIFT